MVLPKAIEKFRFHCVYEKNLSLKTMHAYDADLNQFLEKFKNYCWDAKNLATECIQTWPADAL